MDSTELKEDLLRVTPPAGITMTSFMGIAWSDWVYILTAVYTLLQIGFFIYKMYQAVKKENHDT